MPGDRYRVATTVDIAGGNSGGAAVDTSGRLVAVPSARLFNAEAETTGLMVPVDLAEPLIAAVQAGRPYVSPWFAAATGREQARDLGWSEGTADCGRLGEDDVSVERESLSWAVVVGGLAPEHDIMVEITSPDGSSSFLPSRWDGDSCLVTTVTAADLALVALDDGEYEARLFVGPTYSELLTSQVELSLGGD